MDILHSCKRIFFARGAHDLKLTLLNLTSGAEDDEWDDEWDDVKSSGYAESEGGDGGAIQRGGVHASSMKISLNK